MKPLFMQDVKTLPKFHHNKKISPASRTREPVGIYLLWIIGAITLIGVYGEMYLDTPVVSISQRTGECVRATSLSGEKISCAVAMKHKYFTVHAY